VETPTVLGLIKAKYFTVTWNIRINQNNKANRQTRVVSLDSVSS